MKQVIKTGVDEINGEKIIWTYSVDPKTKEDEIKTFYDGHWLIEEAHGAGLDSARSLLRKHIKNIQSNKKELEKASDAKT